MLAAALRRGTGMSGGEAAANCVRNAAVKID